MGFPFVVVHSCTVNLLLRVVFSRFHFFLQKKRNKENRKIRRLRPDFAGSRTIALIEMNGYLSL